MKNRLKYLKKKLSAKFQKKSITQFLITDIFRHGGCYEFDPYCSRVEKRKDAASLKIRVCTIDHRYKTNNNCKKRNKRGKRKVKQTVRGNTKVENN